MTVPLVPLAGAGRLQLLGAVRVGVGLAWAAGLAAGRRAAGAGLPRPARRAAGALAARDVAQGALLVVRPGRGTAQAGVAVDLLHALSLLPVVVLLPRYRRAALVSGAVALGWVAAGTAAQGRRAAR